MAEVAKGKTSTWGQRVARFFREVRAELSKVIWPNRTEVIAFTSVVVVSVLAISLLIWVVDSAISRLLILMIR